MQGHVLFLDKVSIQMTNTLVPPTSTSKPKLLLYTCDGQVLHSACVKMAAKVALFSSSTTPIPFLPKPSSSSPSPATYSPSSPIKRAHHFKINANLGDGELKPKGKKKFITREEEPEQFWQTSGEREGENPMKTPLPYIIIFGMSTPFVILAIAFANGWIKVPAR